MTNELQQEQGVTIEMRVSGMRCSSCSEGVRRALTREGAQGVRIDHVSGALIFEPGPRQSLDSVKATIEKLGYQVSEASMHVPDHAHSQLDRIVWWCMALTFPMLLAHLLMPLGVHIHFLHNPWVQLTLSLPVYLYGAWYFGKSAWPSVKNLYPNMDVLIFISSSSAMIYSLIALYRGNTDFLLFEAAASIVTLVLLGNYIEHRAVQKTTSAIQELEGLQPTHAMKLTADGQTQQVEVSALEPNDLVRLAMGDSVPLDGFLENGRVFVDESMLTGESISIEKVPGDKLLGGSVIRNGTGDLRIDAAGADTFLQQLIKLVRQAQREKPAIQRLGDLVSAVFVPVVLIIAAAVFFATWLIFKLPLVDAVMRMVAVLAISCPCAMGLATPMAIAVGVGRLTRQGVLVKGGSTLERLARIGRVVFDKTGTLTSGHIALERMDVFDNRFEPEVANHVAALAQHSNHPISKAVARMGVPAAMSSVKEIEGCGVEGYDTKGRYWQLGSAKWLGGETDHDLFVACNRMIIAGMILNDRLRPGSDTAVADLKALGIDVTLLSGDRTQKVAAAATRLGIADYLAEQVPANKLEHLAAYQKQSPIAMVGDGINDAPALARADVGISMGQGTRVAMQSAQVVLLRDDLQLVPEAIRVGRLTVKTIKENLFWAFAYNFIAIPVAAMGWLNPMWAALFMSMSDVVIFVNSLRLRKRQ